MIYLVTGLPRTGTSMMMRAIALSSELPYIYDRDYEDRLRANEKDPSYDPNPNGYWVTDVYKNHDYTDKLAKIPLHQVTVIPKGDCKVILMNRNRQAVIDSYRRSFNSELTESFLYICEEAEQYLRSFAKVTEVSYEDVIDNPTREFTKLRESGWDIDVEMAASLVDGSLERNGDNKNIR